ncbi:hypothetical protein [Novipirellula maiorica]|nr:hypothetical protein [Rhodopirellula maiorica]
MIASSSSRSAAQNIIYPNAYPSAPSYPTTHYPTSTYPAASYSDTRYPVTTYPSGGSAAEPSVVVTPNSPVPSGNAYASPGRWDGSDTSRNPASSTRMSTASATVSPLSAQSSVPMSAGRTDVSQNAFDTASRRSSTYASDRTTPRNAVTRLASIGSPYSNTARSSVVPGNTPGREVEPVSMYAASQIQAAGDIAAQFRRMAQTMPDVAAKIAEENANFVDQWTQLAEAYRSLSDRVSKLASKLSTTKGDYQDVRTKLDHYGLTPTVGLLLRHKKEATRRMASQRFSHDVCYRGTWSFASATA